MGRRAYTAEQIINKLREVEVLLSQGITIGEASRKIGVTEQTYYRWSDLPPMIIPLLKLELPALELAG